ASCRPVAALVAPPRPLSLCPYARSSDLTVLRHDGVRWGTQHRPDGTEPWTTPSSSPLPSSRDSTRRRRSRFSTHSPLSTSHAARSDEHTSELQSRFDPVCRPLLEKQQHI